MEKTAKTSGEYINAIKGQPKRTKAQRTAAFNQIKRGSGSKSAALTKIGQGFVGPVMMRLKYEGIVRNILTEDIIAPGDIPVYDIADEMGKAYFLDSYQGEVMISQYEGKRVMYGFRNLAAFPVVQEQDLLELTIDMADYAINEARQRIQEEEDGYLFSLLDTAIEGITATTPDWAGQTTHVVNTTDLVAANFYAAAGLAANNRLDSTHVIMNPADYFDILNWDLTATSVSFRDKVFDDGVRVKEFAGFDIFRSVICEKNKVYVLPDSEYLGRMPVRKSLDIVDDPKAENFSLGWVMSERINELILNSGGAFRIDIA